MRLDGRRESSNVEDRRGSGGSMAGIGGIGGVIIAALVALFMGGDPAQVISEYAQGRQTQNTEVQGEANFTEEEQELAKFSRIIEASTEDVWTKIFAENGWGEYKPPTLVLYTGQTSTACGTGSAAVGPFYCSGDQKLYIDLSFFTTMKQQLGAGGDFAYAYVIAHEVGHHVEYLLGILNKAHQKMNSADKTTANKLSVRLELLADFYAGVWAHYEQAVNQSLEVGDMEEAIDCAHKIGDDYLQKNAQGYAVPESFTHGTSQQRMKWFKLGFDTGDMSRGNTFDLSDSQL